MSIVLLWLCLVLPGETPRMVPFDQSSTETCENSLFFAYHLQTDVKLNGQPIRVLGGHCSDIAVGAYMTPNLSLSLIPRECPAVPIS